MLRYSIFFLATLTCMLISTACKKDLGNSSFTISLFSSQKEENKLVHVEILGAEIHFVEGELKNKWFEIPMDTAKLDISEIQQASAFQLGKLNEVPVGRVDKIRLKIGTEHTVNYNGSTYPLSIQNVTNDYATLNCNVYMKKDKLYTYFIDLNAKQSVTGNEMSGFILNPIVVLANVYEN